MANKQQIIKNQMSKVGKISQVTFGPPFGHWIEGMRTPWRPYPLNTRV